MIVLGITYMSSRNTAACIIQDGKLVAFSEEERFNRIKHAPNMFPTNAIKFCLDSINISQFDVDVIAISQADGVIDANHPITIKNVSDVLGKSMVDKIKWYPHHDCHAISAIIPSKFEKTNYMTADGFGDTNAGVYGFFDGETLNHLGEIESVKSLGGYYSWATNFLGFRRNSEEGKTMGLASYGNVDTSLIPEFSVENEHGILECDADAYRDYLFSQTDSTLKQKIDENILCEESVNFAATIQHYLEMYVFSYLDKLSSLSNCKNLCVAGGSFLNCTANGKISKRDDVENFFIQPASNDSGTALGAAILCYKELTSVWPEVDFTTAYWGSEFDDDFVEEFLIMNNINYERVDPSTHLANLINDNKIVGYFQGKSEVGPRALCHRSIIANPTIKENLDRVNVVKNREFWRPLAPVMVEEYYHDIVDSKHLSPFMLMACEVKEEWRDRIPATTHVDNSCRPQSINKTQNPIIHSALLKFREMTGVPVFMNTSFNVAGEPLVDSPQDAIRTFYNSGLDALIINKFCILK